MVRHNSKKQRNGPIFMQIAYHIGANRTDQDRLLKSVLKNADAFSDHGVKVPGPSKYRRLVRETIQKLEGTQPAPDVSLKTGNFTDWPK